MLRHKKSDLKSVAITLSLFSPCLVSAVSLNCSASDKMNPANSYVWIAVVFITYENFCNIKLQKKSGIKSLKQNEWCDNGHIVQRIALPFFATFAFSLINFLKRSNFLEQFAFFRFHGQICPLFLLPIFLQYGVIMKIVYVN